MPCHAHTPRSWRRSVLRRLIGTIGYCLRRCRESCAPAAASTTSTYMSTRGMYVCMYVTMFVPSPLQTVPHSLTHPSLNREKRQKELLTITQENQDILKRIQAKAPSYDHTEWLKDHVQSEQYKHAITRFPHGPSPTRRGKVCCDSCRCYRSRWFNVNHGESVLISTRSLLSGTGNMACLF